MKRFLACAACQKTEPFQVHATADLTEWEVYPPGWFLWNRNGVLIPACSEACAEVCAEVCIEATFGNRPVPLPANLIVAGPIVTSPNFWKPRKL